MSLNDIYHSLDPIAFQIGPFAVRWYGLAYLAGFILAGLLIYRIARRWGLSLSPDDVVELMLGIAFGVIIGGRLGYVLFYGKGYYLAHPLSIVLLNEGGMSFHGGLIGAIIGGTIAAHTIKLDTLTTWDLGAIAACPGLALGRIANFINGELWGKPTKLVWGVVFETGGNVARHPSQLYEALLEGVVMFGVLYLLSRKLPPRPQGSFLGVFLLLYGVFRFVIEFVRVPDAHMGYLAGFLTMGQLLSLPLMVAGCALLLYARRRAIPQRMSLRYTSR